MHSGRVQGALVRSPLPGLPLPVLNIFHSEPSPQQLRDEIVLTLVYMEQKRKLAIAVPSKVKVFQALQAVESQADFVAEVVQFPSKNSEEDSEGKAE